MDPCFRRDDGEAGGFESETWGRASPEAGAWEREKETKERMQLVRTAHPTSVEAGHSGADGKILHGC